MDYRDYKFQSVGTIDIENDTIAPQIADNTGTLTDGWCQFGRSGDGFIHLFSDDISDSIAWALQISGDGTNWDAAEENGTAVTGTLVVDEATVIPISGIKDLFFRISFTVTVETGNISYMFKAD